MAKKLTIYNDDEPLASAAPTSVGLGSGNIVQNIYNRADASLEKTDYRLVLELIGFDREGQIGGVDIIAVLDVSYTMEEEKLEKLKTSMKFLVKKLNPIDRLSIVTFSSDAKRLCPLTGMNKNGQAKIEMLINDLDADGYTNITPGLQTAISVLAQRRQHEGRTSAIMLVSSSKPTWGCVHPSTVDVTDVPVYTFGLGNDHDSQLLQDIASRSNQGTYSIVDVEALGSASMNIAFTSCLAGLLRVVAHDLVLTVAQKESEIMEVRAGIYEQTRVNESVKISLGNLRNLEKRCITVFVSLSAVEDRTAMDILKVLFSYRPSDGGKLIRGMPISVTVNRTFSPVTVDPVEVCNEFARGDTAAAMQTAREQTDAHDFEGAENTLNAAEKSLDNLNRGEDELIKALKYEVQESLRKLRGHQSYRKEGRPFTLSSNNLRQSAARGDATQLHGLDIEVPSADEVKNNPIVAQLATLNQHLSQIAGTLKAIQDSIAALTSA